MGSAIPWAGPTQTSRAFLQLAPNIKLVYVPKLSLDGHSESVRQGISDFLAVLSLLPHSPLAAYICVAAAGARRLLVMSGESQDFPHLECRCQD